MGLWLDTGQKSASLQTLGLWLDSGQKYANKPSRLEKKAAWLSPDGPFFALYIILITPAGGFSSFPRDFVVVAEFVAHHNGVSRFGLGPVEEVVRGVEEVPGRGALVRVAPEDALGDCDNLHVGLGEFVFNSFLENRGLEVLGHVEDFRVLVALVDDDELVAPVAGAEDAGIPLQGLHHGSHEGNALVTGLMAVIVVVFLEVVDIENLDGPVLAALGRPVEGHARVSIEAGPVVHLGQGVRDGLLLQDLVLLLDLPVDAGQVVEGLPCGSR